MAAITQLRHKHSQGRAYYDKKVAEGKTHKDFMPLTWRPRMDETWGCAAR
jgi:hypothetical protein